MRSAGQARTARGGPELNRPEQDGPQRGSAQTDTRALGAARTASAADPTLAGPRRHSADDGARAATAADLVAALWRDVCAVRRATDGHPSAAAIDVRVALGRLATDAELLAIRAHEIERPAAHLLAVTARAAHAALDTPPSAASAGASDPDGTLPSAVLRRLARMEQWLSARAAADPTAEPAANLCLWIVDQLEGNGR